MASQTNQEEHRDSRPSRRFELQRPVFREGEELYLGALVPILWKGRYLIGLGAAVCALAGYLVSLSMNPVYEATATLIVMPPRFTTELRPNPLSVETYERILGSDAMVTRVTEEARNRQIVAADESVGLLTLEIHQELEPSTPYQPVIDLIVQTSSPERASQIANLWAQMAVLEGARFTEMGREDARFILEEYPNIRERVLEQQARIGSLAAEFDRRKAATTQRWENAINDFRTRWNLNSLRNQLLMLNLRLSGVVSNSPRSGLDETANRESLGAVRHGLYTELAELQTRIRHQRSLVNQLKEEVQAHPQFLTLSKSISDDALWNQLGSARDSGVAERLSALKLESQEVNPVYQHLLQQLADAQVRYEALLPLEEHLQSQIEESEKELSRLNALLVEKEAELLAMRREMDRELSGLQRDYDLEREQLQRELESTLASFSLLSERYEIAQLAGEEHVSDLKIAASAITPLHPVGPRALWITAGSFLVGMILSATIVLGVALVRHLEYTGSKA